MASLQPGTENLAQDLKLKKDKDEQLAESADLHTVKVPIDQFLALPNLSNLSPKDAVDVLLKSEEHYVERALRTAAETFEFRLRVHIQVKDEIIQEEQIQQIFLNISQIYAFNRKFFTTLMQHRLNSDLVNDLGAFTTKFFRSLFLQQVRSS